MQVVWVFSSINFNTTHVVTNLWLLVAFGTSFHLARVTASLFSLVVIRGTESKVCRTVFRPQWDGRIKVFVTFKGVSRRAAYLTKSSGDSADTGLTVARLSLCFRVWKYCIVCN